MTQISNTVNLTGGTWNSFGAVEMLAGSRLQMANPGAVNVQSGSVWTLTSADPTLLSNIGGGPVNVQYCGSFYVHFMSLSQYIFGQRDRQRFRSVLWVCK